MDLTPQCCYNLPGNQRFNSPYELKFYLYSYIYFTTEELLQEQTSPWNLPLAGPTWFVN